MNLNIDTIREILTHLPQIDQCNAAIASKSFAAAFKSMPKVCEETARLLTEAPMILQYSAALSHRCVKCAMAGHVRCMARFMREYPRALYGELGMYGELSDYQTEYVDNIVEPMLRGTGIYIGKHHAAADDRDSHTHLKMIMMLTKNIRIKTEHAYGIAQVIYRYTTTPRKECAAAQYLFNTPKDMENDEQLRFGAHMAYIYGLCSNRNHIGNPQFATLIRGDIEQFAFDIASQHQGVFAAMRDHATNGLNMDLYLRLGEICAGYNMDRSLEKVSFEPLEKWQVQAFIDTIAFFMKYHAVNYKHAAMAYYMLARVTPGDHSAVAAFVDATKQYTSNAQLAAPKSFGSKSLDIVKKVFEMYGLELDASNMNESAIFYMRDDESTENEIELLKFVLDRNPSTLHKNKVVEEMMLNGNVGALKYMIGIIDDKTLIKLTTKWHFDGRIYAHRGAEFIDVFEICINECTRRGIVIDHSKRLTHICVIFNSQVTSVVPRYNRIVESNGARCGKCGDEKCKFLYPKK